MIKMNPHKSHPVLKVDSGKIVNGLRCIFFLSVSIKNIGELITGIFIFIWVFFKILLFIFCFFGAIVDWILVCIFRKWVRLSVFALVILMLLVFITAVRISFSHYLSELSYTSLLAFVSRLLEFKRWWHLLKCLILSSIWPCITIWLWKRGPKIWKWLLRIIVRGELGSGNYWIIWFKY